MTTIQPSTIVKRNLYYLLLFIIELNPMITKIESWLNKYT